MKERFKQYLEEHFRHIAPTKNAMEYRKSMLTKMMDRAHELSIKGIEDENMIFDMVVGELGDFDKTLEDFEKREVKKGELKRNISGVSIISICLVALLTVCYLIVGFVSHIWHPTWLIMVGGIFVGVGVLLSYFGVLKGIKKKRYLRVRLSVSLVEIMLSVFVFLLMQLVFNLNGAWLTFLAMVILIVGVDTVISFATNSKLKWVQLPIFVEIFMVMLYVILGIGLSVLNSIAGYWHPAWVMCLGGVVFAIIEIVALVVKRTHRKEKKVNIDESYWTQWDD